MSTKIVRGKRIRLTRVDSCGMPIPGVKNQLVTNGFITVKLTQEMKDADDLEQTNADGLICVADRTAPQIKWTNVELELCDVDPETLSILTGLPQVLDYANKPVGFRVSANVQTEQGFALELWAGTSQESCAEPEDDKILTQSVGSIEYGYFLLPAVIEGVLGDFEVGAKVTTITVKGRATNGVRWGKGAYDVVTIDENGTAGRLIDPIKVQEFTHFQTTTVKPPEVTNGAVALALPSPYYGANAAEKVDGNVDAPAKTFKVTMPDGTNGGTLTITVGDKTTQAIKWDAANTDILNELKKLDGVDANGVGVGKSGMVITVTLKGKTKARTVKADGSKLTPTASIKVEEVTS